jgi:hypothetical protein
MDYTVQKGDCLSSIAADHGFRDWKVIYNAPENADFRKKRPNPNVIHPGDTLFVPEKDLKEESCATDQKHSFKAKKARWVFRLLLRDDGGNPLANVPFELQLSGMHPVKDKTNGEGLIEVPIEAKTGGGVLLVMGERLSVELGELDPVERVRGVQQRLNNLGYGAGPVDGIAGPLTRRALYAFQFDCGLETSGKMDDATRKKLVEQHDNLGACGDMEESGEVQENQEEPAEPETAAPEEAGGESGPLGEWPERTSI